MTKGNLCGPGMTGHRRKDSCAVRREVIMLLDKQEPHFSLTGAHVDAECVITKYT